MPKKMETLLKEKKFDFEKLKKHYPELQNESSRVIAIVGCSFIDIFLNDYLKLRLIEDKKLFKKIDNLNFETRVELCYLTGIINKMELNDYSKIGEIRNRFAHNIGINSFDEIEIADKCNKLEILKYYKGLQSFPRDTPKDKFRFAIYQYIFVLQVRDGYIKKIQPWLEVDTKLIAPEGSFDLNI